MTTDAPDIAGMRAPSIRGVVKKMFGDKLKGGLPYARVEQMKQLISGEMPIWKFNQEVRKAMRKRQSESGLVPGRTKKKHRVEAVAHAGRRAATPVPKRKYTKRRPNITLLGNGVAATLDLAGKLGHLDGIASLPDETIRQAAETFIVARAGNFY